MQPSEYEIQREVEALRDIRRRSTANGGVTLDPDLPTTPGSPNVSHQYWSRQGSSHKQNPASSDGDSSSDSHESNAAESSGNPMDDPFHLFWVPASLHPEIAPAEFRAFLKEHSRASLSNDGSLTRSSSASSSTGPGLGRKRSMLSRQYKPSENDGVENEQVVPLRRNKSSMYTNRGPQLTINDLQRLDQLAEEAQTSDDPSKLRNMLRRSLSMNISPSVIDTMDNMPEMEDEADAPIIVPPSGQILRRAARTKIRKPGLPGDGGGHRFGSSRRGARSGTKSIDRISGDLSDAAEGSEKVPTRKRTASGTMIPTRPESYSEETSIYDSYVRDDEEGFAIVSPPIEEEPEVPPAIVETLAPVLQHPVPQAPQTSTPTLPVSAPESPLPSRTPSPVQSVELTQSQAPLLPQPQPQLQTPPPAKTLPTTPSPTPAAPILQSPPSGSQRKDKEKKGLFGKWGSDKSGKKSGKDKGSDVEKEKDSSFFGSLFGSKKKQEEGHVPIGGGQAAGREAAAALLGASKSSKSNLSPLSPVPVGGNPWARYPIHVERAIYRLSHIKLANPRRPLYEQVLISNLMFWYLGVINKTNNPTPATPPPENQQPAVAGDGEATPDSEAEEQRLERERQERERQEKERLERERLEKERQEKEAVESKKKESPRRGPLTRPAPAGAPRRAEMPVKGPQYEMQHRVMEQEYGKQDHYQRSALPSPQPQHPSPKLIHPQPTNYVPDNMYYNNEQQQQNLPPGAMPPVDREQSWQRSSHRQHPGSSTSPPPSGNGSSPHRRSRSPPQPQPNQQAFYPANEKGYHNGHRAPSRSMSAVPSPTAPQTNGRLRKGSSAHAVVSHSGRPRTADGAQSRPFETGEEDVPLAVYQQQRRR